LFKWGLNHLSEKLNSPVAFKKTGRYVTFYNQGGIINEYAGTY